MPTDAEPELLCDTSAAIALVDRHHIAHAAAHRVRRRRAVGLAGHAWFETYSVLTRLPPAQRLSASDALRALETNFATSRFLDARGTTQARRELGELQIVGGAVYDALVAFAARAHGATLLTSDRRAIPTYERVGIDYELIA